jgi:hypothetical protein
MWPIIPKKCNCAETGTNTSDTVICNHCGPTTNSFVYTGEDLTCSGINNQDSLTVAFQKLDYFLCGGGLFQHVINQLATNEEFTTIINEAFDCSLVESCGPEPTTSTTTSTSTSTSSSTTTTTTTILICDFEGTAFQIY